jgi:hypothetical protein
MLSSSVFFGQHFRNLWPDSTHKFPVHLDTNYYCRTRFGHELLKYLWHAAISTAAIRLTRISKDLKALRCDPRPRLSDKSVKLLAKEY